MAIHVQEVSGAARGVQAYFGQVTAEDVQLGLTHPLEFLKKAGIKVDESIPVEVTVHSIGGSAIGARGVSSVHVTVVLTSTVTVVNFITVRQ